MTKTAGKLLLVLSLLVAVGQRVASAQIGDITIEASIPHAFTVGTTTLPAGKYEIKVLNNIDPGTLEIRSVDGHTAVIFETNTAETSPNRAPRKTELVFNKVGDKYFLSKIWLEGSYLGNELEKTKAEKRLEKSGIATEYQSVVANRSMGAKAKASMESKNTKANQ